MDTNQKAFLASYLDTLSKSDIPDANQIVAEYFCADEFNANECARLINMGKKRATCSLKQAYDMENEPLPKVGRLTVVLNWTQQPICIIKTTSVEAVPFNKVTAEFAAMEGEGDCSYGHWREAHWNFFTDFSKELGISFTEKSELILEQFEKVWPID